MSKQNNENFYDWRFFHLPPVSMTPVVHLELQISPRIFEKIRNGPNGILIGLGESGDTVPLTASNEVKLIFMWTFTWVSVHFRTSGPSHSAAGSAYPAAQLQTESMMNSFEHVVATWGEAGRHLEMLRTIVLTLFYDI